MLVDHFLQLSCSANNLPLVKASEDAIAYLQTLPFSGNIRELKNLVERTLLMRSPSVSPDGEKHVLSATDFQNNVSVIHNPAITLHSGSGEGASLDSMERTAIAASIAKNNGNLSLVAKELGISRGALYRKIEKHGL
jgi:two-component system NtrC family response regulator